MNEIRKMAIMDFPIICRPYQLRDDGDHNTFINALMSIDVTATNNMYTSGLGSIEDKGAPYIESVVDKYGTYREQVQISFLINAIVQVLSETDEKGYIKKHITELTSYQISPMAAIEMGNMLIKYGEEIIDMSEKAHSIENSKFKKCAYPELYR